jgi:hypothetical protein
MWTWDSEGLTSAWLGLGLGLGAADKGCEGVGVRDRALDIESVSHSRGSVLSNIFSPASGWRVGRYGRNHWIRPRLV